METEKSIKTAVIIGSTREGRFAPVVGNWTVTQLREMGDFDVDVIDLLEMKLPAAHPKRETTEISEFVARVDAAEAFVIVVPEYNHGYPASLKFAVDCADEQWWAKPVAFVSYGGASGGIRAAEQLKQVFAELHAVTVRTGVAFQASYRAFDETGQPIDERSNMTMKTMTEQLRWWALALREAKVKRPYAA